MIPVYIHEYNAYTPLGNGIKQNMQALRGGVSGIQPRQGLLPGRQVMAAAIPDERIREDLKQLAHTGLPDTRIEQLLLLAAAPVFQNIEITGRTGVILSTTKGNVQALASGQLQDAGLTGLARFMQHYFRLPQLPMIICNACVSGVMAVAVAKRMIQMEEWDEAVIIAADELTPFVVSGFYAFQALSASRCRPYDISRDGINLGEAAAAMRISKAPSSIQIAGEASVNDANHISGPSRTGAGLRKSIEAALKEAGMSPGNIDFISAHGTATVYNDEMEAVALDSLGMNRIPMHSLKAYFGHTLGTAGLLEAIIGIECMKNDEMIASMGMDELGVSVPLNVVTRYQKAKISRFLKTASGFGGCNTAIIFSRSDSEL